LLFNDALTHGACVPAAATWGSGHARVLRTGGGIELDQFGQYQNGLMSLPWWIFPSAEEFTMAEINKLSVGKVLDKLRSNDAPKKSKTMQLDEKLRAADEELQRLRTATRRIKGTVKKPPAT
jgi:hypothetical protein